MTVLCEWPEQHPTYYITATVMENGLRPQGETKSLEQCRELAKLHKQVVCEIRVIEEGK